MGQNLTLKNELRNLFQLVETKITPEIKQVGGVAVNAIRLLTRGQDGIPPSTKKGMDWLTDVLEQGLIQLVDTMTEDQLEVLGEKLCSVGYQVVIDIGRAGEKDGV